MDLRSGRGSAAVSAKFLGFIFRCPGPHGAGCPDHATTALAIKSRGVFGGLTGKTIVNALTRDGWDAAIIKVTHDGSGETLDALDPVCGACAKVIADPEARTQALGVAFSAVKL